MATRQRNSKGHFVKGGGARKSGKRRKSTSRAIVHQRTRTVHVQAPRRRRHGGKHGGGLKLTHVALAAAGLAFLVGPKAPIAAIPENVAKIPGAKTFGNAAALGGACLLVNHFKPNRWLRLAGIAGVVLAAVKFGNDGADFKYVGDDVNGLEMGDDDDEDD